LLRHAPAGQVTINQSTAVAFSTVFNAVALLFAITAPVLVVIKIAFSRYAKMRRNPSDV
jgi:MFS transporter, DHA2 family, multidrug resistance protein